MTSLTADSFFVFLDHVQSLSLLSRPLHSTELYACAEGISGPLGVLLEGRRPEGTVLGKDSLRGILEGKNYTKEPFSIEAGSFASCFIMQPIGSVPDVGGS